ncbi:MAG: nucleotidyltransferase family protein [Candidatus Pacearchaeota archaeon]
MKAVVFCAGYGTRLYPLTLEQPKALLSIKGKALLEYILERIPKNIGIFIVSNEKFYMNFVWWLSKNNENKKRKIEVLSTGSKSVEDRKGSVHDLLFVLEQEKINDDILVVYGDLFFDFDLESFVDFFFDKKTSCIALHDLKKKERAYKYGVVELDEQAKILSIEEKPKEARSSLVVTGIYIIKKEDLNLLREFYKKAQNDWKANPDLGVTHFFQELCKHEDVYGYVFQGSWKDIGSLEDYEEVK